MRYVKQLQKIHEKLEQGKGRRHRQEALHRAGIVMCVAAWEAYVEDLVCEAADHIYTELTAPSRGSHSALDLPSCLSHNQDKYGLLHVLRKPSPGLDDDRQIRSRRVTRTQQILLLLC